MTSPPAPPASSARHALLIGVDAYDDAMYFPPLRYCANDVDGLAQALRRHNYQVTCLVSRDPNGAAASTDDTPATWRTIPDALARLKGSCDPTQTLWVHFSGHGRRYNDQDYLILQDTSPHNLNGTALRVANVISAMRASGAGRLLLTVDACQVSAAATRGAYDPEFAAALEQIALHEAQGFVFLAATGAGEIAWEVAGVTHGVFSSHLIDGVRGLAAAATGRSHVTVSALADYVRVKVGEWNERPHATGVIHQTPTRRIEGDGDFALTDRLDSGLPLLDGPGRAYLHALVDECATLRLPYAPEEGRATLPLERVYVALAADESSPAERRASARLLERLVRERRAQDPAARDVLLRVLAHDPYAARHLYMDPELRGLLAGSWATRARARARWRAGWRCRWPTPSPPSGIPCRCAPTTCTPTATPASRRRWGGRGCPCWCAWPTTPRRAGARAATRTCAWRPTAAHTWSGTSTPASAGRSGPGWWSAGPARGG